MNKIVISALAYVLTAFFHLNAQKPIFDVSKVKSFEHQLDDVMEVIDTTDLKVKLQEVEESYLQSATELNGVRLGIIYHETALNLSFLAKTTHKGYAQKSFDLLDEIYKSEKTLAELRPFVASYRASALSLVGAETKKLGLLFQAFKYFEEAVEQYAEVSYLPEFLRGSVAENIPGLFFWLSKYAKSDFQSIIDKQNKNAAYANWKIMSFTYWAWANQRQNKKNRPMAISYLKKAIDLDPNYKAGRKRSEELLARFGK